MADIGNEINQHMYTKMPTGLFLGAILFEVNPDRTFINIWNCGMENILFFRNGVFANELSSNALALGITHTKLDNMVTLSIQNNDKFYAYSDGIIETTNSADTFYGEERLINSITKMLSNQGDIQDLENESRNFRANEPQMDDLTIVELSG